MKVLLVNGSSRKNGCTQAALSEVARALNEEEVETEIFFIGNEALPDCIACRKCKETGCFIPAAQLFALSLLRLCSLQGGPERQLLWM